MTHTFSQRGGVKIGSEYATSSNYTWPFAHLTASENGIALNVIRKKYYFQKDNISAIRQYDNFWVKGVQLLHSIDGYPQFIVFRSFNRNKLISELRKLGYHIIDRITE